MAYTIGTPQLMDEVSLADMMKYPIWLTVFEVTDAGKDDPYQAPVIGTNNVTDDLIDPFILLKIKGTEHYISAQYYIPSLMIHKFYGWEAHEIIESLPKPLVLIAIPDINGVVGVEFTTEGDDLNYGFKDEVA
jgi:hypothetical protein